ncbi:MAG: heme-binding domain-containing protein [Acidobacteria bacterium]|nr:heme-binding domain-containing protein [Acidobacteriota bacterium]
MAAWVVWSAIALRERPANSNRPLFSGAHVEPAALAVLDRACRDCHSEATRYPWYSYVAPLSRLIFRDIEVGRERVNFSRWEEYPVLRRQRALTGIANQIQDRLMPLEIYVRFHPEAKLSDAEIAVVFDWAQRERERLILESR